MVLHPPPVNANANPILYEDGSVSLCLLHSRRHRTLRVIDYRSGPHPAKGPIVMDLARQLGAERLITLVERDEVVTWAHCGFRREGTIPGFFKRTDAWVLGAPAEPSLPLATQEQSGLRLVPLDEHDPGVERTLGSSRRLARAWAELTHPAIRVQPAQGPLLDRLLGAAASSGRSLTDLEPFSKDSERIHFACTGRGGFSLLVAVEVQVCYSNAWVELVTSPRTHKEAQLGAAALGLVCTRLLGQEIGACFAWTPVGDAGLGAIFLANRFRKTGLLAAHLLHDNRRQGAFLWTRRLLAPADS
jgi:hypothetical protein